MPTIATSPSSISLTFNNGTFHPSSVPTQQDFESAGVGTITIPAGTYVSGTATISFPYTTYDIYADFSIYADVYFGGWGNTPQSNFNSVNAPGPSSSGTYLQTFNITSNISQYNALAGMGAQSLYIVVGGEITIGFTGMSSSDSIGPVTYTLTLVSALTPGTPVQVSSQLVPLAGAPVAINGQLVPLAGTPFAISSQFTGPRGSPLAIHGQSVPLAGTPVVVASQSVAAVANPVTICSQLLPSTATPVVIASQFVPPGTPVGINGQINPTIASPVAINGQFVLGATPVVVSSQFVLGATPVAINGQFVLGSTPIAINGQFVLAGSPITVSPQFIVPGSPVSIGGQTNPVGPSGPTYFATPVAITGQINGTIPQGTKSPVLPPPAGTKTPINGAMLNAWPFYRQIKQYPGMRNNITRSNGVNGSFNLYSTKRIYSQPQVTVTPQTGQGSVAGTQVSLIPVSLWLGGVAPQTMPVDNNGYVQFAPVPEGLYFVGAVNNPKLALESGTSSGGNTNYQFNDTTKNWTNNEWQGDLLAIVGGTGSFVTLTIQSNTKTQLVFTAGQVPQTDNTSQYMILSPSTSGGYMYVFDRAMPWRGLKAVPKPQPGRKICHYRDYQNRLTIVLVTTTGQLQNNYYGQQDEQGQPTSTIIDSATNCLYPSFEMNNSIPVGSYLRDTTPILAITPDHGETFALFQIPIPSSWASGFTQLASCARINQYVVVGYHQNNPNNSGDATTGYYQIVGIKNPDGTFKFSSADPVAVNITNIASLGVMTCRSDDTIELSYLDMNGNPYIIRNLNLSYTDNTGTWM